MPASRAALLLAFALAWPGAALHAEVSQASETGFTVTERLPVRAEPSRLVDAVAHVGAWWNDEHTFSDHAANLTLEASAGACFCERWAGGSVQHAQVLYVAPGIVRLGGALGPLQGLAVNGVLTLAIQKNEPASAAAGTPNQLVVTYRIGGGEAADMRRMPPLVDGMMGDTAARLARYLDR